MTLKQIIKSIFLTLGLALCTWAISGSTQAKSNQDDFSCTAVSEIPQLECEALVALYDWGSYTLQNRMDWLSTPTPCSWEGITCHEGHVAILTLGEKHLSGAIPSEIGNLANLTELHLYINYLTSIPPQIGNLKQLRVLDLGRNRLSSLPSEIGNLESLTTLKVHQNLLPNLPVEIGNLSSLTQLWAYENVLRTIPSTVGNLTQLTELNLNKNIMTQMPSEIGNLPNLTRLALYWNQLDTLPIEITKLTDLNELEIGKNRLLEISTELKSFLDQKDPDWATTQIDPFDCAMVSEVPQVECEALVVLYDSTAGNNWESSYSVDWLETSTPCSWYGIHCEGGHVTGLTINGNSDYSVLGLKGDLPAEIGNLSNLTELVLWNHQLSSLPAEIGNLSNLTELSLYSNVLSSLPAEIGNLSNLTELSLSSNQLNSLPTEIWTLSKLSSLSIWHSQLGSLPAEIGNFPNLTSLDLWDNQFSSLPDEIWTLSNLTSLDLWDNQLSSLPEEIGNLSNLTSLSLWDNQLTTLPANIVNLTNLEYLNFDDNYLNVTDPALLSWMNANDPDWAANQKQGTPSPISTPTVTPTPSQTPTPTITQTFIPMPTPTATPVFTSTSDHSSLCTEGTQVTPGDLWKEGQFETDFDIDWFTFDGTADTPYRIDVAIPSGSAADVNLELYSDCTQGPTENWIESFAPGVSLDFAPEADGPVYLRLTNADDDMSGPHLHYQLSVRQLNQESETGAVIIVAGRLKRNDDLQDNIYNTTDEVFAIFQEQGYTTDNIYYLSPEPDEVEHYDAAANIANLEWAITQWAAERIQSPDVPDVLTIYMMDHGDIDVLYLDGPRDEELTPAQLDGWLDTLEAAVPGIKINVIIEACHAGSFIQAPGSISGEGRVIITSSDEENDAYASPRGAYFSDQFLTALREGDHLFGSWSQAADVVEELFVVFPQIPWIDGDGDGKPNEREDFDEASRRGFAYAGTLGDEKLWPPYIAQATAPDSLEKDSALIRAEVRDDRAVGHVWAEVYPPSYTPQTSENGNELIDEDLETIVLKSQGDDQYQGRGYNFTELGIYRIVIHADDGDELLARPVVVTFDTREVSGVVGDGGFVYLPFISR